MKNEEIKSIIDRASDYLINSETNQNKNEVLQLLKSGNDILNDIPFFISNIRTKAYIDLYEKNLQKDYDEKILLKTKGNQLDILCFFQKETLRHRIAFYYHVLEIFIAKNETTILESKKEGEFKYV